MKLTNLKSNFFKIGVKIGEKLKSLHNIPTILDSKQIKTVLKRIVPILNKKNYKYFKQFQNTIQYSSVCYGTLTPNHIFIKNNNVTFKQKKYTCGFPADEYYQFVSTLSKLSINILNGFISGYGLLTFSNESNKLFCSYWYLKSPSLSKIRMDVLTTFKINKIQPK
jgi:hypothetical protein